MTAMVTTITGRITRKILASPGFIATAMMMAPISMPGARSIIRSPIIIRFCTWVMSLVSRVTREPVEKLSMFWKENFCTFRKQSFRRSAPKLMDAFAANHAPPMPPPIMINAVRIMTPPISMI